MRTVEELVGTVVTAWGDGARWSAEKEACGPHEAKALTLSSIKAKRDLGWQPTWRFDRAVSTTIAWYKAFLAGTDMYLACKDTIDKFSDEHIDAQRPASFG